MHTSIFSDDFKITKADYEYRYQETLTKKLDAISSDFDQKTLNEIVLWKVNRYAEFDSDLISMINSIDQTQTELDIDKTKLLLRLLIKTKGVRLPMASTILKFRNPNIYQIIDQRVYRIIYEGMELKIKADPKDEDLEYQIELYLKYLKDLSKVCSDLDIPFTMADRILYMADKRVNKGSNLKY